MKPRSLQHICTNKTVPCVALPTQCKGCSAHGLAGGNILPCAPLVRIPLMRSSRALLSCIPLVLVSAAPPLSISDGNIAQILLRSFRLLLGGLPLQRVQRILERLLAFEDSVDDLLAVVIPLEDGLHLHDHHLHED